MRLRERRAAVLAEEPPPELRQFTDPSRPGHDGQDLGVNVYPDRAAWIEARHAWEAEHGVTLEDWFHAVLEDALAFGLQEMNEAFSLYLTEADEYEDPRVREAV